MGVDAIIAIVLKFLPFLEHLVELIIGAVSKHKPSDPPAFAALGFDAHSALAGAIKVVQGLLTALIALQALFPAPAEAVASEAEKHA